MVGSPHLEVFFKKTELGKKTYCAVWKIEQLLVAPCNIDIGESWACRKLCVCLENPLSVRPRE